MKPAPLFTIADCDRKLKACAYILRTAPDHVAHERAALKADEWLDRRIALERPVFIP